MSTARFDRALRWAQQLWHAFTADRLLGGITASILAWNTLPTLTSVPIVSILAEGLRKVQSGLPASKITFGLSVLLLAVLIASFLPRIYLYPISEPIEDYLRVQVLLSAYAFVIAVVWYVWGLSLFFFASPIWLWQPPTWAMSGVVFAGFPFVLLTLYSVESRSLEDRNNYFTRVLVFLDREENSQKELRSEFESLREYPLMYRMLVPLLLISGAIFYATPAALFGVLAGLLSLYYPVLETIALLGIIGRWLLRSERTPEPESRFGTGLESAIDIDVGFYRQLRTAISPRSLGLILPLLFGLMLTLFPLFMGFTFQTPFDAFDFKTVVAAYHDLFALGTVGAVEYAVEKTGDSLVWFALSVTPLLIVCYGLWYWYHVARRIPSLRYKDDDIDLDDKITDTARNPPISRPSGYFIPLMILVVAWLEHRFTFYESFLQFPIVSGEFGFLIVWTFGVTLMAWTVVSTRQRDPEPATSPTRELYVPLLMFYVIIIDFTLGSFLYVFEVIFTILLSLLLYYYHLIHRVYGYARWKRIVIIGVFSGGLALSGMSSVSSFDPFSVVLLGTVMFGVLVFGGELSDIVEE